MESLSCVVEKSGWAILALVAASFLLAGCGGLFEPDPSPEPTPCYSYYHCADYYIDHDGDGYTYGNDCDDANPQVYPLAIELEDGIDNNCDDQVDELTCIAYPDRDGDGFGEAGTSPADGLLATCSPPSGYGMKGGDCNDASSDIHPLAVASCNGQDNNCDGDVDEGRAWFPDGDHDGYGVASGQVIACAAPEGYEALMGDCDDSNASSHPGAEDPSGDGVDQDCGGSDGPQPTVGFGAHPVDSIQAAIKAAKSREVVWVGPGHYYEHDLDLLGKNIVLASIAGAEQTILDAAGAGRVLVFNHGEEPDTVVRGFALTGGHAIQGGGIELDGTSPTLDSLLVVGNSAVAGGGAWVYGGAPILTNCRFVGNLANEASQGRGGALGLEGAFPILTRCHLAYNDAVTGFGAAGGGLWSGAYSSTNLIQSTVHGNRALSLGDFSSSSYYYPQPIDCAPAALPSDVHCGNGGGIYLLASSLVMMGDTLRANHALGLQGYGGGLYLSDGNLTASASLFLGNTADADGGAVLFDSGLLDLSNVTVASNLARDEAGGLRVMSSGQLALQNTIVAYNSGYNLYVGDAAASVPTSNSRRMSTMQRRSGTALLAHPPSSARQTASFTIGWSDLYNPVGPNHNLYNLDPSVLSVPPGFVTFWNDGDPANDDHRLAPGSPLIDAGDVLVPDLDGSRSDMGAYGGPTFLGSDYDDLDDDGMYDAWERVYGLDPSVDDHALDPDGDALSNLDELRLHGDPQRADTDSDLAADGQEVAAGADLADWYSQPQREHATARVPEDFSSLQQAIDAVQSTGAIDVGPGEYHERLQFSNKVMTIRGRAGAEDTVLAPEGGTALTVRWSDVDVNGLSIRGGDTSGFGGALQLVGSTGQLTDLALHDNHAGRGGGGWIKLSTLAFSGCRIAHNSSDEDGGGLFLSNVEVLLDQALIEDNTGYDGGGIAAESALLTLTHSRVVGNLADGRGGPNYHGMAGGLSLQDSATTLEGCRVEQNSGEGGGGLWAYLGTVDLRQCLLSDNEVGGGLGIVSASLQMSWCEVRGNTSFTPGSGIHLDTSANASLRYVRVMDNSESLVGGIYLSNSSPLMAHVVVALNEPVGCCPSVGGVGLEGNSRPQIVDSILAYNGSTNLNVGYSESSSLHPSISYTDLYNPYGIVNTNTQYLDATDMIFEPGFNAATSGVSTDSHLGRTSPLRDKGDEGEHDADGSRADVGAYGGSGGAQWDLDQDGYPDYFWPGSVTDAPEGFDPNDYDRDDLDPELH